MSSLIAGLSAELLLIDDPVNCRCVFNGLPKGLAPGEYDIMISDGIIYAKSGQRFGRCAKDYGTLGELRRQKKAPNTEVLYIWVITAPVAIPNTKTLRSINNCDNDQLTQAIRDTGAAVEAHQVERTDGEFILDMLYKEMARRVESAEQLRARRYQGEGSNQEQTGKADL